MEQDLVKVLTALQHQFPLFSLKKYEKIRSLAISNPDGNPLEFEVEEEEFEYQLESNEVVSDYIRIVPHMTYHNQGGLNLVVWKYGFVPDKQLHAALNTAIPKQDRRSFSSNEHTFPDVRKADYRKDASRWEYRYK